MQENVDAYLFDQFRLKKSTESISLGLVQKYTQNNSAENGPS
jgi:hypothetical protein